MNTSTFASTKTNTSTTSSSIKLSDTAELGGRVLLSSLFVLSGLSKITAYAATMAYMSSLGVPNVLLPAVIATELLGGLAIAFGWKTRVAAFLLAGFSLLTALVAHTNFADQIQMIMFLKNVSIAGGFLLLTARGAGRISLDSKLH
ncbi:DoxX family protein [Dyella caseinilytica]|uniref:DoxX family protein n=1 Tax=Dyella caseinilytica TaxID=1849581 RepID=A0ABX7GPG5_9GAMM|nr:DoxX family protein [Dyella caseinilytica]QRN52214.1 DoxX family protein [Dyella caseinilytica]GGA14127.1 membrane protein [Dyella caseinilytica]